MKRDWAALVEAEAQKWGHIVYAISGERLERRSKVFWACLHHSEGGTYCFPETLQEFEAFLQ